MVKNLPANAGDARDVGSIPGSGRSPGGGNGNPLQYSCLGNPIDRGAWRTSVQRVAKGQTHTHAPPSQFICGLSSDQKGSPDPPGTHTSEGSLSHAQR